MPGIGYENENIRLTFLKKVEKKVTFGEYRWHISAYQHAKCDNM